MKLKIVTIIFALSLLTAAAWADSGSLSFIEGQVTLEKAGAGQQIAVIGDTVQVGDTVYTGSDGFAEISLSSGSIISIQAGSVFNVGEVSDPEAESRKRGFFRVLLGNVAFKFRNLTQEPDVGTPLAVCSVRGTDFTVYTAPDGASMTVVSDGLVEVSSGGESTLLAADEGVEVVAGLGLGEPFDARTGFVRYDAFVGQALERIDENPISSILTYSNELARYVKEGEFFLLSWNTNYEEVKLAKEQIVKIREEQGDEIAEQRKLELVIPLQLRSLDLVRTYRFNFLSGLYLRRYVLSSMYIHVRSQYLANSESQEWIEFISAYDDFLKLYDTQLIPFLEDEDL
jgi:hypothetical protein